MAVHRPIEFAPMPSALTWLNSNAGVVTTVGIAVGAVVIWIVYRFSAVGQRKGVLDALRKELDLHESWVQTSYVRGRMPTTLSWWETNYEGIPFKLSTTAIEAAIAAGPSLFLNRQLLTAVVAYRQRVIGFNQLVDRAAAFQANPELYRRFPSRRTVSHVKDLLGSIHYVGVGHAEEGLSGEGQGMANYYFRQVSAELRCEESLHIRSLIWSVTGLRLSPPYSLLRSAPDQP